MIQLDERRTKLVSASWHKISKSAMTQSGSNTGSQKGLAFFT
jgi:hypothetical protein